MDAIKYVCVCVYTYIYFFFFLQNTFLKAYTKNKQVWAQILLS